MLPQPLYWLSLAQLVLLTTTLAGACASEVVIPVAEAGSALKLADGSEIAAESLRCIYRQSTGASDELSFQLQFLSSPNHVAFAAYLNNPVPAKPFVATSADVDTFSFEAFPKDTKGFRSDLAGAEIAVRLDELPRPEALHDGEAIQLHGRLDVAEFSLPAAYAAEGGSALRVAACAVAVDCVAKFQVAQVVN